METSTIIYIVLAILIAISCGTVFYFLYKYIKLKKSLDKHQLKAKYDALNNRLKEQQLELDEQIIAYRNKLLDLSNKSEADIKNEIKTTFTNELAKDLSNEIRDYQQTLATRKSEILTELLVSSYQNILEESIHQASASIIKLDDVNLKGRIIGKEGRNKKIFEYLTGVDLVIDKVSDYITVSSLNPIRRTIAVNVINELIKSKNIEPSKIENCYEQELNRFNQEVYDLGKSVCLDKLHAPYLNEKIYPYIGRLNYRSSYSQNILSHALECAYIAKQIAFNLGIDEEKAKLAAFFHDIGKAVDFEIDKNHIDAGVEIAHECKLDDYIIEAIKTHHNDGVINSIYSEITKIADAISASRPGARIDSYDDYIKRVNRLEEICNQFEAVNGSYVIKSGRQLRVMVNPKRVDNYDQLEVLSHELKNAIEQDSEVGSYKIKVILIKEDKLSFETSQNKNEIIVD